MISKEVIYQAQVEEKLDDLFEDCFCGGGDFGVYRIENLVYKIAPLEAKDEFEEHPDATILKDLNKEEFFPKMVQAEHTYVVMSFEKGTPLDTFVEEEEVPVPEWARNKIYEAIEYIIMTKNYDPLELEPRHVLIDEEDKSIKIIDVTGYEPLRKEKLQEDYKKELVEYYFSLFDI